MDYRAWLLAACAALALQHAAAQTSALSRVVQGYYPAWTQAKFPPEQIDVASLTHVSHAFVWPDKNGGVHVPTNFLLPNLNRLVHAGGSKIILCVGGGDGSKHVARVALDVKQRARFVASLSAFAIRNSYDGIEIDWEFPKTEQERIALVALVRELRATLGVNRLLTVAVSGSTYTCKHTDAAAMAPLVDYFVIMAYDYHGGWSEYSGHNAPLLPSGKSDGSIMEGVQYWLSHGMPRSKLVLGMPFYGRMFNSTAMGASFTECDNQDYREITQLFDQGYVRVWDSIARVPVLHAASGKQLVTYDDAQSLAIKTEFALTNRFAGVAIWQITGDIVDGRHLLLPGIYRRVYPLRLLGTQTAAPRRTR